MDLAANDPVAMMNGPWSRFDGPVPAWEECCCGNRRSAKHAYRNPGKFLHALGPRNGAEKLMQVVLVGQTELDDLLEKDELRQLKQRIAVRSAIAPLTPENSLAYVKHRLSMAGQSGDFIFERKAIDIIIKAADGVPRMLNILCDNALIAGFGYQKNPVTASIAKEIVSDFAWQREMPHARKERLAPLVAPREERGNHRDRGCRTGARIGCSRRRSSGSYTG